MDLVNRAIQYDRRSTEKPFLLNRHALLVWPPTLMRLQCMWQCSIYYRLGFMHDLRQSNVAPGQIPHKIINAHRYLCSPLERRGASERWDRCGDRIHMRSIDQHKPVASTGIGTCGIVGEWLGQRRIALDQMHGDDSIKLFRIEFLPQCGAQLVLA